MGFMKQVAAEIGSLSKVERFALFATVIGLIVDLIALASYVGIVTNSQGSSRVSTSDDEFFVWMLIALLYSLGFVNSYVYTRWRRSARPSLFGNELGRRASLAALTSFPCTFVYLRALRNAPQPLIDLGSSAWDLFFRTAVFSAFLVIPLTMLAAHGFDTIILTFSSTSR